MVRNIVKKLVSFTNYEFVDSIVKDMAYVNNMTESAVIEKCIMDMYMPNNINGATWVKTHLCCENSSIGRTLQAAFGTNAAGIDGKAKYDNFLPIVEFAKKYQGMAEIGTDYETGEFQYMLSNLNQIIERYAWKAKNTSGEKQQFYETAARYGVTLMEALENKKAVTYMGIYDLLLQNWTELKDNTYTYRTLTGLTMLKNGFITTPGSRIELLKILKAVTDEWKE